VRAVEDYDWFLAWNVLMLESKDRGILRPANVALSRGKIKQKNRESSVIEMNGVFTEPLRFTS
jgi:hypothetical protein